MNEHSPFDAAPDPELGAALREALAMPFGGAFVNRVRSRLNQQRQRSWDDELAGWFWQTRCTLAENGSVSLPRNSSSWACWLSSASCFSWAGAATARSRRKAEPEKSDPAVRLENITY